MSNSETFWFHCGRCGSLFQSQAGEMDDRLCSKCGSRPELELEASRPIAPTPPAPRQSEGTPSGFPDSRDRQGKPRNSGIGILLKVIGGWTLLLTVIILGARTLWPDKPHVMNHTNPAGRVEEPISQEDQMLLREATPKYGALLQSYLAASTPEEKNQFVLSSVRISAEMARFYNANPLERINPEDIILARESILQLPDGKAIETLWNTKDSRRIEAVFHQENGEWKLEWKQFVRFSELPWPLFLAGGGEAENEFRLLARERLAKERKDAQDISIVLYAPKFGNPGETGFQSPEFNVPRDSPEGKLLGAAFEMKRAGQTAYRSELTRFDPEEMIRVRLSIRRTEVEGVKKFAITRVLACHWHEIDDPGIPVTDEDPSDKIPSP